MLLISLFLAALGIGVAAYLFEQLRHRTVFAKAAVPLLATAFGEFVAMAMLALHFFLLCPVLLAIAFVCLAAGARTATFVMWSAGAAVLITLSLGAMDHRKWADVRRQYPLESLAERLAYENDRAASTLPEFKSHSSNASEPHIETLLDVLEQDVWQSYGHGRTVTLAYAHATQVRQFINSQGFGVGRGVRPSPSYVTIAEKEWSPDAVKRPAPPPSAASESAQRMLSAMAEHEQKALKLLPLHRESLVDFANAKGFGWVKDLRQVAGFRPHRFSELPNLKPASRDVAERWRTTRVDLVSLLKHEQPMAYVSSRLPKMDELRDAPVRPLDAFEQEGLSKLRQGDELVVRAALNRIRMLGPIPALRQCLECHQARRGELLGAFSYEFLRDPPIESGKSSDGELPSEL